MTLEWFQSKHFFDLPCTANTLQGRVPWRDDSLFPPLMKAGRLGLLWSPTNFPGCCPIRAGCQAAAGTLQAGRSCSPCSSGPPSSARMGRRSRPLSLAQPVLHWSLRVCGVSCVDLRYSSKSLFIGHSVGSRGGFLTWPGGRKTRTGQ